MRYSGYYDSLPPFPGGKRQLLGEIDQALQPVVPVGKRNEYSFLDAFSGACSVSLWAKLQEFKELHSNDCSFRSQLILKGLIKNNYTLLDLESTRPLFEAPSHNSTPGFVESSFANHVFATPHARALEQMVDWVYSTNDPITQALRGLALWKMIPRAVAYGTSIGTSNRNCAQAIDSGNYHLLNPKRLRDGSFKRQSEPLFNALPRVIASINKGVFPALGQVYTYQSNILDLLPTVSPDIAYFDPPYANTAGYGKEFSVLDAVLFRRTVPPEPESVFTISTDALSTMLDLARHIPIWIVSYNDKVLTLDELVTQIQQVAPKRTVTGKAIAYKHMPHVSKRENHELLVIAY